MTLRDTLRAVLDRLADIDLYNVRFIPEGANEPRPPVPDIVGISAADVAQADELWNLLFPEYENLLDADVRGQKDFDG